MHIKSSETTLLMIAIVALLAVQLGWYGKDEHLYTYAKTGMINESKPLAVCYKTSTFYLVLPVYTTDTKVLCNTKSKTYVRIPMGEKLRKLQSQKLLPKPLPDYKRPILDYLTGFMFWIVLAGLAIAATMNLRKQVT